MANNKDKLNLSIDEDLKKDFKHISISENKTCSEIVEIMIKALKNNREIIRVLEQMGQQVKRKKR
jgi:antitoxin component of RelBE/YafQ-DinJ toxin-antitoxin module